MLRNSLFANNFFICAVFDFTPAEGCTSKNSSNWKAMDMATRNHEEFMKALVEKEPTVAESVGLGSGGVVPITHGRGKACSEDAEGSCLLLIAAPSSDFGRVLTKLLEWEKKMEKEALLVRSRKVALTKEQCTLCFGREADKKKKSTLIRECSQVKGEILALEFNVLGSSGADSAKEILEEEALAWIAEGEVAVDQSKNLFSVWKEDQ